MIPGTMKTELSILSLIGPEPISTILADTAGEKRNTDIKMLKNTGENNRI